MTGAALTREEWESRYLDAHGNLRPVPHNGGVPGQQVRFTDIAAFLGAFPAEVDVLGTPDDEFLTILGGDFDQRIQLPTDGTAELRGYSFTGALPANWSIELGTNAPAFGRSGGARYVTVITANGTRASVFELLDLGVLVERAA